jgi:hypothetical protein
MAKSVHLAAINSMSAKIERLEADNVALKRENERLRGSGSKATRKCADCGVSYPDTAAFFGASFDDPDKSRCAACARTALHFVGSQHVSTGCRQCNP